jgi:hypothetical protein
VAGGRGRVGDAIGRRAPVYARPVARTQAGNGHAARVSRARKVNHQELEGGGQQKALIFTESRRTQEYLYQILEKTEFASKVVLFNGSNTDPKSKEIYQRWLERNAGTDNITNSPTSDKRAALVEYFRDEAAIMIATEAAAEGSTRNSATWSSIMTCRGTRSASSSGLAGATGTARSSMWWSSTS